MCTRRLWLAASMIGAALLLGGCALPGVPGGARAPASPTWVAQATVTPSVAPPTPVIGPVPANCPVTDVKTRSISPYLSDVTGAAPVWGTWLPGPKIAHVAQPPGSLYPPTYMAPYGWPVGKVIWEVGPHYNSVVTLSGRERFTNTPLLILSDGTSPATNTTLDPKQPGHPSSVVGADWVEWGSTLIVPQAGCYTLTVSWPEGHWEVTFAVGA